MQSKRASPAPGRCHPSRRAAPTGKSRPSVGAARSDCMLSTKEMLAGGPRPFAAGAAGGPFTWIPNVKAAWRIFYRPKSCLADLLPAQKLPGGSFTGAGRRRPVYLDSQCKSCLADLLPAKKLPGGSFSGPRRDRRGRKDPPGSFAQKSAGKRSARQLLHWESLQPVKDPPGSFCAGKRSARQLFGR